METDQHNSPLYPDVLIAGGALDLLPTGSTADHFCMMLATHVLGGLTDLGSALIGVDPRGRCQFLGGCLELRSLGEALNEQPLLSRPWLMGSVRDGYSISGCEDAHWEGLITERDGFIAVVGLREPALGMLLLGARQRLELHSDSVRLLSYTAEKFLNQSHKNSARTSQASQVDGNTSNIVFSSRQLQVLGLLAQGATNTQIGKNLSISASLAKQEVAFITHALQANSRLDAVIRAQQLGIL